MDQHHAAEEAEYGGYGTPTPEQEMPGREGQQADQRQDEDSSTSQNDGDSSAAVPSADAELDDSNSEEAGPGKSFSSEPESDATGLPEEKSPKDDDGETFDAG